MTASDTPEYGTHALAGVYAKAWYDRLGLDVKIGSRRERNELIDEILDDALASAGVLPRPRPIPEHVEYANRKV